MTQREWRRQHLLWTIHRWMRQYGVWFVLAVLFSVALPQTVFAAETKSQPKFYYQKLSKEDTKLETVTKAVEGKLSAYGMNGLAVETSYDEKKRASSEMWFEYVEGMKLSGAKKLSDFQGGDIVRVTYLDGVKKEKQDDKEVIVAGKKIIKELKLLRKKPKTVEEEPEPGGLSS